MSLRFSPVVVTNATTYSVKNYNSGILHIIPDLSATCTITLPTPKAGLSYRFQYGGAAADAQNAVITTAADANYFVGGVTWLTNGTPDIENVYSDGNSNSKLTLVTPGAGTWIEIISNGTVWYLNGHVVSATTPTLGDQ
jgi:hypothetical protein